MIAADVRMVDLEPDGFSYLCALLARRDRSGTPTLQVLHERGRVLRVVHTVRGPVDDHLEPFDDAQARAAELLAQADVERVVLIDRSQLDNLWGEVEAFARPDVSQGELLWAANDRFWSHPAVATAPARPYSSWPWVSSWMAGMGDDWWAVFGAWRGEDPVVTLLAHVQHGRVRTVTSAQRFGGAPQRAHALTLVDRAEQELNTVPVVLLCDAGALESALVASGLPEAIELLVADAIYHRGIKEYAR